MNGTLFGRSLWDCGSHVSTVRLDEYPIRRCIHEQEKLQRDEDQGELNLDSTQRPLQGAFLIPPVLPVVLIPVENLWHYLRAHHWSNRPYTGITTRCRRRRSGVCVRSAKTQKRSRPSAILHISKGRMKLPESVLERKGPPTFCAPGNVVGPNVPTHDRPRLD